MSITLLNQIDHLLVTIAAIAALSCLVIWGGLSVDVAAPAIISLGGLSSGAAVLGTIRTGNATVVQAPPSGGSATMGAQG